MIKQDVIVIGAGAAGIAAACRLLENNVQDVIVLEARNRIGGRIHSVDIDGSAIEMGAQWCHGEENNIVYTLAKDLNVLGASANNYENFNIYSPTLALEKDSIERMFLIADNIANDNNALKNCNESFGDHFKKRFITEITKEFGYQYNLEVVNALLGWLNNFHACLNACPTWNDLSAKGSIHYQPCEGNYYLHWKNKGYKTILDILMKEPPYFDKNTDIKQKIFLNKTVTKVKLNKYDDITVLCEDGSCYAARQVLVTLPLGVLKKMKTYLFEPQLPPSKLRAIDGLGFGTVNKIFLEFPKYWWQKDPQGISIVWTQKDTDHILQNFRDGLLKNGKSWLENIFGFYPIDSHSNILLVWTIGPYVEEIGKLSDDTLITGLMLVLRYFVGFRYPEIPNATSILSSNWHSDPYAYGSYSYRSMQSEEMNVFASDLGSPVCINNKPVLMFAGEATSSHQYSTVHGAISSGFREADRIINMFKKNGTKGKL